MLSIAPTLLLASMLTLLGSVGVVIAGGLLRALRGPRLAVPSGPDPGARASISSSDTAHVGVVLALLFLVAALALRGLAVGHAPWSNLYEVSQAYAAGILIAYLLLERRFPIRGLAPAAAMLAALLVGHALTLPATAEPLVPALQQPLLLTVHVAAAMLAYGIYAVAFTAAAGELAQGAAGKRIGWLPPADVLRAAGHRAVVLGFPVLTAAIVLGAVWANLAWRSYWNNDPKELTAAATWLIYGAYLHVAGRRDRLGRLAPWFIVAGFGAILLTYFGANLLFPGQHSYTGL